MSSEERDLGDADDQDEITSIIDRFIEAGVSNIEELLGLYPELGFGGIEQILDTNPFMGKADSYDDTVRRTVSKLMRCMNAGRNSK